MDQYVTWATSLIVSLISLLLMHGLTAYLIEVELIQCLIDALMRWTLGSETTPIPVERNMHDVIASGVGFLDNLASTQPFQPDTNYPVYISEPLVVLSLRSLFEKQGWTTRQAWMAQSFRNARNKPSAGYIFEEAVLCVLMEAYGGEPGPLATAFQCMESLGSRKVALVSLRRGADGNMQYTPVSWTSGSSDCLGFKARSLDDVLAFLGDPGGKAFLFPDTHMGPDLVLFFRDEETKELILLAVQGELTLEFNLVRVIDSVTPRPFYTTMVRIKPL